MTVGLYVLGAGLALALADTMVGPVIVAFLVAAVLFNGFKIVTPNAGKIGSIGGFKL